MVGMGVVGGKINEWLLFLEGEDWNSSVSSSEKLFIHEVYILLFEKPHASSKLILIEISGETTFSLPLLSTSDITQTPDYYPFPGLCPRSLDLIYMSMWSRIRDIYPRVRMVFESLNMGFCVLPILEFADDASW